MREAIRAFWQQRSGRERSILGAGALLLLIAMAYAYLWLPVSRERERLLGRVPELRIAVQDMEHHTRELERLRSAARPADRDLKSAIEEAGAASGIAVAPGAVTQQGADQARVSISAVRASQWLRCIARLQSAHSTALVSTRMISLGDGDRVRIEAVFARSK